MKIPFAKASSSRPRKYIKTSRLKFSDFSFSTSMLKQLFCNFMCSALTAFQSFNSILTRRIEKMISPNAMTGKAKVGYLDKVTVYGTIEIMTTAAVTWKRSFQQCSWRYLY